MQASGAAATTRRLGMATRPLDRGPISPYALRVATRSTAWRRLWGPFDPFWQGYRRAALDASARPCGAAHGAPAASPADHQVQAAGR